MNSIAIIIISVIVLIICVVAISIVQKREQEKALLQQKIGQYRYRANNAANVLSNFSQLPIGIEARQIIMQYCLANMKAIAKLSPTDLAVKEKIESLTKSIQSASSPADQQKLAIPSDLNLLTQQVNRLSNLAKFILKLNKSNLVQTNLVPIAVNKIMALISESKVCAYIQQGKEHLSKHEYVPAQRSFIMAQQMMLKIANKNERIKQLEVELQELIKSSPTEAMNTQLSFDQNEETQEEAQENENNDGLFGPRKKW